MTMAAAHKLIQAAHCHGPDSAIHAPIPVP